MMNLGENIICPSCKAVSIPPYYSCHKNCPLNINKDEWEGIRAVFESQPIACYESRTFKCNGSLWPAEKFVQHIQDDHKIKKMIAKQSTNPRSLAVVDISTPADKVGSVTYFKWPSIYFEADGKIFLVHIVYEEGNVYWWITGNISEKKPNEYKCETTLKMKENGHTEFTRSRTSSIRCLQFYDFEMVKKLEQATLIDASLLLGKFCRAQCTKKYQNGFTIRIRVSKKSK